MHKRVPQLHISHPLAAEILRNIGFAVSGMKDDRRIGNLRCRRKFARINCFRVVKRLKRGAGLEARLHCADKLVSLIKLAAADKRGYVPRLVFNRNHRPFDRRFFIRLFCKRVRLVYHADFQRIHTADERHNVNDRIYSIYIDGICDCFRALAAHFDCRQIKKERQQFRKGDVRPVSF